MARFITPYNFSLNVSQQLPPAPIKGMAICPHPCGSVCCRICQKAACCSSKLHLPVPAWNLAAKRALHKGHTSAGYRTNRDAGQPGAEPVESQPCSVPSVGDFKNKQLGRGAAGRSVAMQSQGRAPAPQACKRQENEGSRLSAFKPGLSTGCPQGPRGPRTGRASGWRKQGPKTLSPWSPALHCVGLNSSWLQPHVETHRAHQLPCRGSGGGS